MTRRRRASSPLPPKCRADDACRTVACLPLKATRAFVSSAARTLCHGEKGRKHRLPSVEAILGMRIAI
ncbi:hypothetical protein BDI4_560141 [Burkholderia diffusa]|nr:hypothetical protein BDI4_560141 [Burkholderia diffusa]